MGVYISEITMPKGEDSKLVLQIFPNGEVYDEHGIQLGITNWAEAVPVSPHGRLIDADALLERLKGTARYFDLKYDIVNAPAIIKAEEN